MEIFITTLIAGGMAAGVLGTLHHQLKPLQLSPVANYVIGSAVCLVALSVALIVVAGRWDFALMAWGIWALPGLVVGLAYGLDYYASKKREELVKRQIEKEQHGP